THPPQVFDDIAAQAVQQCVEAVGRAGELIKKSQGGPHKFEDALFLIANLLNLREQLAPFALALKTSERELDFSATNVTKALGTFLSNRRRMLSMSRENALLQMGQDMVPGVHELESDKKQELEDSLKLVVTGLVERVSSEIVGQGEIGAKDLGAVSARADEVLPGFRERLQFWLDAETVAIIGSSVAKKLTSLVKGAKKEGGEAAGVGEGGGDGEGESAKAELIEK
ncbi:hypothetical protein TeGR_g10176, partial [Tetraparma gracilis]